MTEKQLSLLKEIMAYRFAVLEFNLYLNTHPKDKGALDKYNEYVKKLRELCFKYQTAWPWQINYG